MPDYIGLAPLTRHRCVLITFFAVASLWTVLKNGEACQGRASEINVICDRQEANYQIAKRPIVFVFVTSTVEAVHDQHGRVIDCVKHLGRRWN